MFIEISDGMSINVKKIEAVEYITDLSCQIYTENRTFKVQVPKQVIIGLIESRMVGENTMSNVEKLMSQLYSTQQTPRI
jgi:hypothetical protein